MSRNYKEYQISLFDRLIHSSKYPENYTCQSFKTKDLSSLMGKNEANYLFNVFQQAQVPDEIIPLATGGVIVKVEFNNTKNLVLLGSKVDKQELENLPHNAPFLYKDDNTIIALFILLSAHLRIKSDCIGECIDNILGIIENDDYDGHNIRDIMDLYESIYLLEIKENNPFENDTFNEIISLSINIPSLLHYKDAIFLDICNTLSTIDIVDKRILYGGLTAFYRRHAFLDIYRCLEKNFYFPKIYRLYKSLQEKNASINISYLREKCRDDIEWIPKENDSIQELFSLIYKESFQKVSDFKSDLKKYNLDIYSVFPALEKLLEEHSDNEDKEPMKHIAREIYKYRNVLVHHEDKKYREQVTLPNEDQWQILANLIGYFLIKYNSTFESIFLEDI